MVHGEEEDGSAGTLIIPKFLEGADTEKQGPSSSKKDTSEGDDEQVGSRQMEEPMQQDANQAGGEDDSASTGGVSSLISISSVILRTTRIRWRRLSQQMKALRRWNLRQPLQK